MSLDGDLIVHAGITRSGKTLRARLDVKDAQRLIVWDPKGAWARDDRCEAFTSCLALLERISATGSGPGRFALVSTDRREFDAWARLAFWWGRWGAHYGIRTNVVAEEIANVTSPAKAPEGFHLLITQGLEFGITLHVLTQAPSECEKTSFRNRTLLRVFQTDRAPDARMMAQELRIDQAQVDALKPLEYLERDRRDPEAPVRKFRAGRGKNIWKWTPGTL